MAYQFSVIHTKNYSYDCGGVSECHPVDVFIPRGLYLFEVYGASGGNIFHYNTKTESGKGGYSWMLYKNIYDSHIYLYIGGQGSYSANSPSPGGWNGGGSSAAYGASGGGATDIRLIK